MISLYLVGTFRTQEDWAVEMKAKEVVLVIDMLNDFCTEGGALFSPRHAKIIPSVERFLEEKAKQGARIMFASDWHEPEFERDPESRWFSVPHAVRESWGAQVVDELKRFLRSPDGIEIKKTTPDAFLNTNLGEMVKKLAPDSLTVVGVCTDICIEATARTARYLGYVVEIPESLVATYDAGGPSPHPGDQSHEEALRRLRDTFGVKVTKG